MNLVDFEGLVLERVVSELRFKVPLTYRSCKYKTSVSSFIKETLEARCLTSNS